MPTSLLLYQSASPLDVDKEVHISGTVPPWTLNFVVPSMKFSKWPSNMWNERYYPGVIP